MGTAFSTGLSAAGVVKKEVDPKISVVDNGVVHDCEFPNPYVTNGGK